MFFVQSSGEEHEFLPTIQDDEISDVLWVDVNELVNAKRFRKLPWSIDDAFRSLRSRQLVLKLLQKAGFGELFFPCIYLPRPSETNVLTIEAHQEREEKETNGVEGEPVDLIEAERHRHDFILWGLTLRMTSELFGKGGLLFPLELTPVFPSKRLGQLFILAYRNPIPTFTAFTAALAAATAVVVSKL